MLVKKVPDFVGLNFLPAHLGHLLHDSTKFYLQPARQLKAKLVGKYIGNTTLTRLTIHTDNILVGATQVTGIDWKIGDLPCLTFLVDIETFLNSVLMGTRECSKY